MATGDIPKDYKAAWTPSAAAEVAPAQIEAVIDEFKDELTSGQRRLIVNEICRLTAAAEVGEWKSANEVARLYQAAIATTIERCAQVADEWPKSKKARTIAANIRALKDKP